VGGLNTTEIRERAKAQGIEGERPRARTAELVIKFKSATGR